jgi:hypothetical protein
VAWTLGRGDKKAADAINSPRPSSAQDPAQLRIAQADGIPAGFVIIASANYGPYSYWDYQLVNAEGLPLTGPGYFASEDIYPDVGDNGNGYWTKLEGGVFTDKVGLTGYPNDLYNLSLTQGFTVIYNGASYQLSTVFLHVIFSLGNGDVYTTVTPIVR